MNNFNSELANKDPDFFIVGAPKCGTTSMTHYLDSHPEIFFPDDKDFYYFGSDINYQDVFVNEQSATEYFSRFEPATEEQIVGETTVMNLYSRRAAEEIYEYNPDTKIIIMLRKPVEMLYSLHSHFLFGGNEDIKDFQKALEAEEARKKGEKIPETVRFVEGLYYREICKYPQQIKRYFKFFPKSQIHFIIFENFVKNTEEVYQKTLEFLGVSSNFRPKFKRLNPNKKIFSWKLNQFVRTPPRPIKWLIQTLDRVLPARLFRKPVKRLYRLINTSQQERSELSNEFKRKLEKEFRPMIKELETLIDRDLSVWKH